MSYTHGIIENIPIDFKPILDRALELSFDSWVDEKGTEKHPDVWRRQRSNLSIDEAYNFIDRGGTLWEKPYIKIHSGSEVVKLKHFDELLEAKNYCEGEFPNVNIII